MQQRSIRLNASEETIKIGSLGIRFLLTGDDSGGSVSVFEVFVPVGQKLAAPATRTMPMRRSSTVSRVSLPGRLTARPSRLVPGRRYASPEARCTASIISATKM
jgi:hypothetical protein